MRAPHILYLDEDGAGSILADPENGRIIATNAIAQQTVFVRITTEGMRSLAFRLNALADAMEGACDE